MVKKGVLTEKRVSLIIGAIKTMIGEPKESGKRTDDFPGKFCAGWQRPTANKDDFCFVTYLVIPSPNRDEDNVEFVKIEVPKNDENPYLIGGIATSVIKTLRENNEPPISIGLSIFERLSNGTCKAAGWKDLSDLC